MPAVRHVAAVINSMPAAILSWAHPHRIQDAFREKYHAVARCDAICNLDRRTDESLGNGRLSLRGCTGGDQGGGDRNAALGEPAPETLSCLG